MQVAADEVGPVSAVLEAEVSRVVRQHGLVIWLDPEKAFTGFVDRWRAGARAGFEVRAFRGSHLELMLDVIELTGGLAKPQLLVHVPGFDEAALATTPLLELAEIGRTYTKSLETLVVEAAAGRVQPGLIDRFHTQGREGAPTLEEADAWLAALSEGDDGLAAQLEAMGLERVVDELLGGGPLAKRMDLESDRRAVRGAFERWTGLPTAWRDIGAQGLGGRLAAEAVAFEVTSWALAVEYVHDLSRPPTAAELHAAKALPAQVVANCTGLARALRRRREVYIRTADATEAALQVEVIAAAASDLGRIDTFRFEEELIFEAALAALGRQAWDEAAEWAQQRLGGGSFWVEEDVPRRSAWELIGLAAALGQALRAAGPRLGVKSGGLGAAVQRYEQRGAAVDAAHRRLEARRLTLLDSALPKAEVLRARLDAMRRPVREWSDAWASDFNALCRAEGFLPEERLLQRAIFDEVVKPLVDSRAGAVAYFLVDALRFEMGAQLAAGMREDEMTTVEVEARLAELPTVTEVGMNALAPVVERGRLGLDMKGGRVLGLRAGEFRVCDPESRRRAMHDRIGGRTCPSIPLHEVVGCETHVLKQKIAEARLVVVHSLEIDQAGEQGLGLQTFEGVLRDLTRAWRRLRSAGVQRFVVTADHGFLLADDESPRVPFGKTGDAGRRHVFRQEAADEPGNVRMALGELRYDGADGHLVVPETAALFANGKAARGFAHGGNSLQERVIPVITVTHTAPAGGRLATYRLEVKAGDGVAGLHRLKGRVRADALSLDDGASVALGIRVVDAVGVDLELVQVSEAGSLHGGLIDAKVGGWFEAFFRLTGPTDVRVQVEVHHPLGQVEVTPARVDARYAVSGSRVRNAKDEVRSEGAVGSAWLAELPDSGVREVFAHIEAHGAIREDEAARMLGSPRAFRRFARAFELHAAKAPFEVRIEDVGGVKRYVRDGGQR